MLLKPKDYVEPVKQATEAPTDSEIIAKIKATVTDKPKHYCDVMDAVETTYKFAGRDKILELIKQVDTEWHPEKEIVEIGEIEDLKG